MEVELLKHLPNGGAVAALIVVVVLFLKKEAADSDRVADRIGSISAAFASEMRSERDANRGQVKAIIDEHMTLIRETIVAIRALDATVREMQTLMRRDMTEGRGMTHG